jgi:hypothetical protein
MKTTFHIGLNMKTTAGFERYAWFDLGSDREFAYGLFAGLEGSPAIDDSGVLHMDFIEKKNGLPVNIKMIGCTATELARNVGYITRELFKFLNLNETFP